MARAVIPLLLFSLLPRAVIAAGPCEDSGGCQPWQWSEVGGGNVGFCTIGGGIDFRVVLGWSGALTGLAGGRNVPAYLRLSCDASPCVELFAGLYQLQGVQVNGFPVWGLGTNATTNTSTATLYWTAGYWVATAGETTIHVSAEQNTDSDALPHEVSVFEGDLLVEEGGQDVANLTGFGEFAEQYKTYFFCPAVDDFTALTLKGSASALASTVDKEMQVAVYGAGKSGSWRIPSDDMDSRVTVWTPSHPKCPGGGGAVADFLVYNVTLRNGRLAYLRREPIGNGFVPTCEGEGTDARCGFDPESICIGSGKHKNCGKCYNAATPPEELDVSVFVTYHGTDAKGDHFLSGSSNPVNFRQFAMGNIYGDLRGAGTDVQNIFG